MGADEGEGGGERDREASSVGLHSCGKPSATNQQLISWSN